MTTILPPGKSQFFSGAGVPLAGGSVQFYIPGTTTPKATWQDSAQSVLNTNPIILDAAGEAIIYGQGAYRQQVFDSLSNLIWDQLTSSTDTGGIYSGGTTTGTAANQIIAVTVPSGFTLTAGNQLTVIAGFTATGPTTLNAAGQGSKNVLKPGATGPIALVAGDFGVGDAIALFYDGTQFQLLDALALPLSGGTLTGKLTMSGAAINEASATIASTGTLLAGNAAANYLFVTGTTTITGFDNVQSGISRTLEFAGSLTLTNNAVSFILPGGGNIQTAAGDVATFRSEGSQNWRCTAYQRASGAALAGTVIVQDRKATTTAGGSLTQNTWTDLDLNTLILNTVGGVTAISTPNLTLPAGTYDVTFSKASFTSGNSCNIRMRLFNTTDAAVQQDINGNDIVSTNISVVFASVTGSSGYLRARFTIAAQKNLKFQAWNGATTTTQGVASAGTGNTEPEVYSSGEFVKVG